MISRRWTLLAIMSWALTSAAFAVTHYEINIATHVMRGDKDVFFSVVAYDGVAVDTVHRVFVTFDRAGVTSSPDTTFGSQPWNTPWQMITSAAAVGGLSVNLRVTQDTLGPVFSAKTVYIDHTITDFEIFLPGGPVGVAGTPFVAIITAKDAGGATVLGFNDTATVSSSHGDILVNGVSNTLTFVDGVASVNLQVFGTDPVTRNTRITVSADTIYFTNPRVVKTKDISITPGPYAKMVQLFPGEVLKPGDLGFLAFGKDSTAIASQTSNVSVSSVTVYLVDTWNNPIINPGVDVNIGFDSEIPVTPADVKPALVPILAAGGNRAVISAGFTMYQAGLHTIRAFDMAHPDRESRSSPTVIAGDPSQLEFYVAAVGGSDIPDQRAGVPFLIRARIHDGTPAKNPTTITDDVTLRLTDCTGGSYPEKALDADASVAGWQGQVHFQNGFLGGGASPGLGELVTVFLLPGTRGVRLELADPSYGGSVLSNCFNMDQGPNVRLLAVPDGQVITKGLWPGVSPDVPAVRNVGNPPINVKVYVVDDGWNQLGSVAGGYIADTPVTLQMETGYVDVPPGDYRMPVDGGPLTIAGVTYRTAFPAGDGRFQAIMGGMTGYSSYLTLNPGTYSKMVFVAPGETLAPGVPLSIEPDGATGVSLPQTVNVDFTIRVYLTDTYFNPIINAPFIGSTWPTLTFSTAPPTASTATVNYLFSNPFNMTDSSFEEMVRLGTIGSNVLRAVDTSPTPLSETQTIQVDPGEVTHFVVTPDPDSDTADLIPIQTVGVAFPLTFKAFDASGYLATNFSGPVKLQLLDNDGVAVPGTISPSTVTFAADPIDGGKVVNVPITITYAGKSLGTGADGLKVRAYVDTPTMREGKSAAFSVQEDSVWQDIVLVRGPAEWFTPGLGPPYKIGTPSLTTAGEGIPLTLRAVDKYGNRVDRTGTAELSMVTLGIESTLVPISFNNGEGFGTVYIRTAGVSVLLASAPANGSSDRSTGTIRAGSYSASTGRLVLLAPGEVLIPGLDSPPGKNSSAITSIEANTSMAFSLYACDTYYNRDNAYSGDDFSLSSDDGAINLTGISVVGGSTTVNGVFLKGNSPPASPLVRVTATDQASPLKTSYSDVPVTPGASYVVTVPSTATVGVLFPMTVTLFKPDGSIMSTANHDIFFEAFTSSGGASTVSLFKFKETLSSGTVTFDQSYGYVETIKIQVTDHFNRLAESGDITVKPNGLKYKVTLPAGTTTADDIFTVTVGLYDTVQDVLPIRSSTYQHNFSLYVVGGVGTPVSAALNDGEATVSFNYTKAGNVIVRASGTLAGYPPIEGLASMYINPGAYVKLAIIAPDEVLVEGVPSVTGKDSSHKNSQAARQPFPITVYAVDRNWNIVKSLNTPLAPSIRLTATDGSLTALPLQGFSSGETTFPTVRLFTPPIVKVTAEDTLRPEIFPAEVEITVTGRAYVPTVISNFPPDFYSGPTRDFRVEVRLYSFADGVIGDPVSYGGNVTIEPFTPSLQPLPISNLVIVDPSPGAGVPSNVFPMNPSGLRTLTLAYRVAEDVRFKFTDEDGWQGFTSTISFIPREVDYVVTTPVESRVGPPDTFTMTITPRDHDTETTAKNWARSVLITAVSPAAIPITGTLHVSSETVNGGAKTFQQAFSQAGVFYFTVSDGVKTSTSAAMNFLPGPLASMTTDIPDTIEAGSTPTVRVTLFDAFTNPIPNLPVTFSLSDDTFGDLLPESGVSGFHGWTSTVFDTNDQKSGSAVFTGASGGVRVSKSFRLLGPPSTSLRVGGLGIEEGKGYAIKPDDPIYIDIAVEPGTTLDSVSFSVNGGSLNTMTSPFRLLPTGLWEFKLPLGEPFAGEYRKDVGRYTVEYYGKTVSSASGLPHSETVKTSKTFFVSAETTAEEGLVNYPNPFRAGQDLSFLEYVLTSEAGVRLTIYDMMGQRVYERSYSQGEVGGSAGLNRISWDGKNNDGEVVGNGGYVAVLEVSGGPKMRRKIAVKK